jgi:hypothetical protein
VPGGVIDPISARAFSFDACCHGGSGPVRADWGEGLQLKEMKSTCIGGEYHMMICGEETTQITNLRLCWEQI